MIHICVITMWTVSNDGGWTRISEETTGGESQTHYVTALKQLLHYEIS